MGATAATAGHCCAISSASAGVRVGTLPAPKLTPPLAAAPGRTNRLLAPMLAIVFCDGALRALADFRHGDHRATPMITPKAVRAERILFRRKAPKAVRKVGGNSEGRPLLCGSFSLSP